MKVKKPSMKTVKKSMDSPTTITNCVFTNKTHFDENAVTAVMAIANALKSQADACSALAKVFTSPTPVFESMLKIDSPSKTE